MDIYHRELQPGRFALIPRDPKPKDYERLCARLEAADMTIDRIRYAGYSRIPQFFRRGHARSPSDEVLIEFSQDGYAGYVQQRRRISQYRVAQGFARPILLGGAIGAAAGGIFMPDAWPSAALMGSGIALMRSETDTSVQYLDMWATSYEAKNQLHLIAAAQSSIDRDRYTPGFTAFVDQLDRI